MPGFVRTAMEIVRDSSELCRARPCTNIGPSQARSCSPGDSSEKGS